MILLEDIRRLAQLARLKLMPQEEASLQKDISSILEYVGQVSAVSNQGPTVDAGSSRPNFTMPRNVMRIDMPYKEGAMMFGKREVLLKAFPQREGDYNTVRKIIEKDA